MGAQFEQLDRMIQNAHTGITKISGVVQVSRGIFLAGFLCRILKLPESGECVNLVVNADHQPDIVYWERNFSGRQMNSRFKKYGDCIQEKLGPLKLIFRLNAQAGALHYNLEKTFLWRIPLPALLAPKLIAYECELNGLYRFKVSIYLPVLGKLIEYQGDLNLNKL